MREPKFWGGFDFDERKPFLASVADFIVCDHRYVFLGTSIVAAIGVLLSGQLHPQFSFLRSSYELELVLYGLLLAWLALSAAALVTKLVHWRDYEQRSPFARPNLRKIARYGSYAVWAIVAVFVVDRVVMGIASSIARGISATENPTDDLESAAYMVSNSLDIYQRGITNTIIIAIVGTICAFIIALILVFLRIQRIDRQDGDFVRFWKVLGRFFSTAYSTVIRSTPMMVQTFVIYYSVFGILKASGMTVSEIAGVWSAFTAGIVIMSLNSSPYMLEVLRAGIEAVDAGQVEAARSLGLSQWQAMVHVVFPQGIKNAVPALSNEFIINIKDSSILSVIGVLDLMFATTTVSGMYFKTTPVYLVAAGVYFVLAIAANKLLSLLTSRLGVGEDGREGTSAVQSHGEH